jgi:hypothetical protein
MGRLFLYATAAVVFVVVAIALATHDPDYCKERKRHLSDAEKIRLVIEDYALGDRDVSIRVQTARGIESRSVRLHYPTSAEAVLKATPDCCRIQPWYSRHDAPPPPSRLASWFFGSPAVVRFTVVHDRVEGEQVNGAYLDGHYRISESPATFEFQVDACGKILS